uniref:Uncharacterized protein n=1 Tax=Oryza glumipatula TaxID=40148 RepID=A0A0E0AYK3_9ORYZ
MGLKPTAIWTHKYYGPAHPLASFLHTLPSNRISATPLYSVAAFSRRLLLYSGDGEAAMHPPPPTPRSSVQVGEWGIRTAVVLLLEHFSEKASQQSFEPITRQWAPRLPIAL